MTRRFGTRWIRCRSKMDGVRFIGTISTVVTTTGTTMAGGRHATRSTGPARTREDFLQHISNQQPLKQAMQFFAESVCRDNAVLDLRLSTTTRGRKTRASQRKLGANPSMRRRWNMKSQLRVRQASTNPMNCFQARCRTEGAPASCRCCDDAPGSGLSPATTILAAVANFQTRVLKTEVEFPFISHACLRPLARALFCRGARCWVDRWD